MDFEKLCDVWRGEPFKVIRARVERQRQRFAAVDDSAKHLLTSADLAGAAPYGGFAQRIGTAHLAEAVQYRPRWQV